MSHSSAEGTARPTRERFGAARGRGQVEPVAALAAVFAVTVGLGLYTGALHAAVPNATGADLAPTALDTVAEAASGPTGIISPARLTAARVAAPDGHRLNVTLSTADRRWQVGPRIPAGTSDRAARRVPVAIPPNRVDVGRLRVVVW